ncbi:MAG: hypothetical protein A2Z35_06145 [Actinobacteria bacterium RBG_19FT_COMBO_36_27]|nr:MAG: hypothetical protein A2Z35_06145 [Actinobacteria bacterium RBG_19FT_COMBO_36_27]
MNSLKNNQKLKVNILREIWANNDGSYIVYTAEKEDGTEMTVNCTGFELRPGKTTVVGQMREYKGQPSFKADYEEFDSNSYDSKFNLLCSIEGIKERTAAKILDALPENNIEVFYNKDAPKIKGIGPATIEKIHKGLTFLRENKNLQNLIALVGQGVGNKNLHALNKYLLDSKIEIDDFKKDPYTILIDKMGVSFKKVDYLAQNKFGCDTYLKSRCLFLTEQIIKAITGFGHTYTDSNSFTNKVINLSLNPENLNSLLKDEDSRVIEDDQGRIQTKAMQEAELSIPRSLKNIEEGLSITNYESCNIDILVREYEVKNNITLHGKQKEAIIESIKSNSSLIIGGAGCVDSDTEYFNGLEWKRISEYQDGEKVLQYNKDGSSELIIPKEYVKYPAEYLWNFKTRGLDQCLSDEHNVYYITSKNNLNKKTFKEIKENHEITAGFKGKFITTFCYSGIGLNYSEWEIRLKIAIKADGTIRNNQTGNCQIHLKKQHKIERLRLLLHKNNINYTQTNQKNGYISFYFNFKTSKIFDKNWYNCTKQQFEIVFDEVFRWDGRQKLLNDFSTSIKENADYIQFVCSSLGYRSGISIQNRIGKEKINGYEYKSIEYTVHYSIDNLIGLSKNRNDRNNAKTKINKYKTKDGLKYCFETYSGMLILRRNNKIFITGNTGKSTIVKGIIYVLDKLNNTIICTAPTGKASRRLAEATDHKAYTCHRFYYGEEASIEGHAPEWQSSKPTTMIIDEFSMVDTILFFKVLYYMAEGGTNFTRIILVGDPGQLPSVGAGSVMADIIKSAKIKIIELTNTFRQAEGSNILKIANMVRVNETFPRIKEKDFFVSIPPDLNGYILRCFTHQRDITSDLDTLFDEFQICTSSRKRANEINEIIQAEMGNTQFILGKKGAIGWGIGDKIMNTKNDYNNDIYNGEFGRVVSLKYRTSNMHAFEDDITIKTSEDLKSLYDSKIFIKNCTFQVYYSGLYKTVNYDLDAAEVENFQLSYCTTIHKLQGSEFKICVCDVSEFNMITDSRLLYTAITRAKKQFILLSNGMETIDKIVINRLSSKRDTLLLERINKVFE